MDTVVSYLVPSFNHEKYLTLLLESIKEDVATLTVPTEIIILDDGSSDNSCSMIQDWVEANEATLKIQYAFQKNCGISAVFNTLIEKSSGQYIRICATDDLIIKGSTQLLLNEFQKNPEILCALGDGQVIDEGGGLIHNSSLEYHGASVKRLSDKKLLLKELIQRWCVAGPSILIKRTHYAGMRYNESSTIEDFDLFLSLLNVPDSIAFIRDQVCAYRIHQNNTSKTKIREKRIINMQSFLQIIEKYLPESRLFPYLLPLKYKSKAKIYYLEKKFIRCGFSMLMYGAFQVFPVLRTR